MKEKDKLKFYRPDAFNELYISEHFIIQESRIFYLGDGQPLDDGICDTEDLLTANSKTQDIVKYVMGPFMSMGGNRFKLCIYDVEKHIYQHMNFRLPDSKFEQMLNCRYKDVNLSTYLNNGQILLQIEHRFMIFAQDGVFLD
jgi:hypothetical protein